MPNQIARTGANLAAGAFIPQIYSAKLQDKFYAASVVPAIANHNWEGEIMAFGDTVNIRKVPTISINDYSVNNAIAYQDVSDEMISLNINKAKYYAFKVDYIDDYQSDIALIDTITQDASMQMAVTVDKAVLQSVYADAATTIAAGALSSLTTDTYIRPLLEAGQALDESGERSRKRFGRYI